MTREELIRAFGHVDGRCHQKCPFANRCRLGQECVMRDAAMILTSDKSRMELLEKQIDALKISMAVISDYAKSVEETAIEYYKAIRAYCSGETRLQFMPKNMREYKKKHFRMPKVKKPTARDKTIYDGNPLYAQEEEPKQKNVWAKEVMI